MRYLPRTTALSLVASLLLFQGCDSGTSPDDELPADSRVVSSRLIQRVTRAEIGALGIPVTPQYDVDLFQIVYMTPGVDGVETTVSGAVAIPVSALVELPLVSYQHGTEVRRDDVASISGMDVPETLVAVLFATSGYLGVMPDYIGLGVSTVLHPYTHAATLASATVDMLRASRDFAAEKDLKLSGQVFLIGYSEGGSATAAAQRLIESSFSSEFDLVASAPMAGSYDMSGVMVGVMRSDQPFPATYYLPYLMLAYDQIYGLFNSTSDVFVAPYAGQIPGLYDGTHGAGEINSALPAVPVTLLQPDFVAAFDADENHPMRVALRDNDLYDWAPETPTRLYHCTADDTVPFANSQLAFDTFTANGSSSVKLMPLSFGGHVDCAAPALILGKFWFDSFLTSGKTAPSRDEFLRGAERLRQWLARE
jgi:Secretory lipase